MIPKFRAWTEEGEAMYYDVYPFKDGTLLLSYDEVAFDEVPASDFILMQSTGLKDKNGKEMYEGDSVKFHDECQSYTGVVTYMDTYACFAIMDKDGYEYTFEYIEAWYCLLSELEVIGNIWEDGELLEVEE